MGNDSPGPPPFAQQRLIYVALLVGPALFAAVVAFVTQSEGRGVGSEPVPELGHASIAVGAVCALAAITARGVLRRRAETLPPEQRPAVVFTAGLMPLAMLEGGMLFAITVWLVNGATMPALPVAAALFALALLLTPFTEPAR